VAPTALPVTGGLASSRVEGIRFREIVNIRSAHTDLVGNFNPESGAYSTLATAVVEGLDILGVVTADRIVARLASRYLLGDEEPYILTRGSHFENLRVAGKLIDFEPDHQLQGEWGTYEEALPPCRERGESVVIAGDTISTSIGAIANTKNPSNQIDIPDFGSVHLGEIFIKRGERHLTMLRIELGCAYEGRVACNDVEGDAHSFPP
jgi:hypothetical protein